MLLHRFGPTTDAHRLRWRHWLQNPDQTDGEAPFALHRTDIDQFDHATNTAYWRGLHELTRLVLEVCTPLPCRDRVPAADQMRRGRPDPLAQA